MTCFSYKHKKTKNTVPTVLSPKPGADPVGGGAYPAPPPKIGKNMIFLA